jgi:glycosyltransferase involved in cell wall biosynthesis
MAQTNPIITIAIPAYNSEKTITESLKSALSQVVLDEIEILVCDDGCTDKTVDIIKKYPVKLIHNEKNIGIGKTLERLMNEARGKYIIYLCSDDQFTNIHIVSDYIRMFGSNPMIGVIGRYYYQYMNGYPGAIMVSRDENILTQSCNPSGMAFKRDKIEGTNKIFIECPFIVKQYLIKGYRWTMFRYDTIKAKIHPGGNTGTKESYYKGSMYQNWFDLLGEPLNFPQGYIQLKNRSPKTLWREICVSVKLNPKSLLNPLFWFYSLMAVIVPAWVLKPLSNFYRHRVTRLGCRIIERKSK